MNLHQIVIAEVGSVHDGSFGNALKLIDACADAGADVAKFQTHIAAAETLKDAPMPPYFKGEPRFAYFERTGFTEARWRELAAHCKQRGIGFLSSPFSIEAAELLDRVGVDAFKIPSGEVSNLPMLDRIADTGKPVLLSSGMSNWTELDAAVGVLRRGGPLMVMQCATAYPCPPERVGLNVIAEMRARYKLPIGYSDHAFGPAAALAAAAHGAVAIEKHFTFSRAMYGSDAATTLFSKMRFISA
jgi:N,N'-diacetyllegionaminate synthase